jgi:hypothetical protein
VTLPALPLASALGPNVGLGSELLFNEGRLAPTALSARDLNCSDQFRPSPEGRASDRSETVRVLVDVLAWVRDAVYV